MFCQKCGTQNPETGRFCRNCGADLGNISEALSGKFNNLKESFGIQHQMNLRNSKKKPISYESAISKMFTGIAFLTIAIILGVTGMAGGHDWWFWMLIPGFGALGSGIAQIVQIKSNQKSGAAFIPQNTQNVFNSNNQNAGLPPSSTNFNEIQNLVNSGNKITAIKVYRETYDVGLKEAKDAVEMMERRPMTPPHEPNAYVEPPRGSIYETGDLSAPSSVTENTTRHLRTDSENETNTLPKSNL